jgi:hypothetical protein
MTIVVGIGSPDGLILAADSRTTRTRDGHDRVGTDMAQKLFILTDAEGVARYGVATYGWALIGDRTINGLMDEFVSAWGSTIPVPRGLRELADSIGDFFHRRFKQEVEEEVPDDEWALFFALAGYDESGVGHLVEIKVPGPKFEQITNTTGGGLLMRGQTTVLNRLIKGVDLEALDDANVDLSPEVNRELNKLAYPVEPPVALQDAADMAASMVKTTIDMQRFFSAANEPQRVAGCGGAVQVLAVRREGAEWLARRSLELAQED